MNTERLKNLTYLLCVILGVTLLGYLFLKYVLMLVMPFLIAWAVAFAMRPPSAFLSRHLGIKVRIVRPVLTILVTVVSLFLLGLGVWRLSSEIWSIISGFGEGEAFRDFISDFLLSGGIFEQLFGTFGDKIGEAIYNIAVSLLTSLGRVLTTLIGGVPRAFLFIVITLISTVYFALDLERINHTVLNLLPSSLSNPLVRFKNGFLYAGVRYIRSYFLLFLITFAEMLIGLMVLRVPYALLFAVIISILDLLPVIGVGTILIPYGIFELIIGNTALGIGILILFIVHTVIRQFAEPKILGKNLGVHPLITLIVLYVSYALFGVLGLILMPLFTVFIEIAFDKKDSSEVCEDSVCERDDV